MEISALELACFVYRVAPDVVLDATYSPAGGLSVVLDQGIRGAPKYIMMTQETMEAIARYTRCRALNETQAERGVIDGTLLAPVSPEPTSTAQPDRAQTSKTTAPKPAKRARAAKKGA